MDIKVSLIGGLENSETKIYYINVDKNVSSL